MDVALPAPASFLAGMRACERRSLAALIAAAIIGACALVSPPLALLLLAGLAANVLMRGDGPGVNAPALAGPLIAAFIVAAFVNLAAGVGVLFIWRLLADARWSVGEARRLAQSAGRPSETSALALAHAWATPVFGLTLVAYTAPHMVAGLPLDLPHVPVWVPIAAGAFAACAIFDWLLSRAVDWRLGELSSAPTTHLLAHHTLMLAAFGLGLDVSAGIAAVLAWRLAHAAPVRLAQPSLTAVP